MINNGGQAIYNILINDATVSALISTRCYPLINNATYTVPFVTYQNITTLPNATKSGASTLDYKDYQINIIGQTPYLCRQLAEAVRDALDYSTYTGVQQIFFLDERDDWNEQVTVDGACMIQQDYRLLINR